MNRTIEDREWKVEAAQRMRDLGASYGEIAQVFGISRMTANRWCDEEVRSRSIEQTVRWFRRGCQPGRKETRADPTSGVCRGCGCLLRFGYRFQGACMDCLNGGLKDRVRRIEEGWHAGESHASMAASLGITMSALERTIEQMRLDGYEVPDRYESELNARRRSKRSRETLMHNAKQMYDQGLTYEEIGSNLGVAKSTIGNWLRGMRLKDCATQC